MTTLMAMRIFRAKSQVSCMSNTSCYYSHYYHVVIVVIGFMSCRRSTRSTSTTIYVILFNKQLHVYWWWCKWRRWRAGLGRARRHAPFAMTLRQGWRFFGSRIFIHVGRRLAFIHLHAASRLSSACATRPIHILALKHLGGSFSFFSVLSASILFRYPHPSPVHASRRQ